MEKIKTIGDCYMCVAWTDTCSRLDAALRMVQLAQEMHSITATLPLDGSPLSLRAGIHAGSVVSGIIGKSKFCFDIWGVCCACVSRQAWVLRWCGARVGS